MAAQAAGIADSAAGEAAKGASLTQVASTGEGMNATGASWTSASQTEPEDGIRSTC